jgi:hypothetical protein
VKVRTSLEKVTREIFCAYNAMIDPEIEYFHYQAAVTSATYATSTEVTLLQRALPYNDISISSACASTAPRNTYTLACCSALHL